MKKKRSRRTNLASSSSGSIKSRVKQTSATLSKCTGVPVLLPNGQRSHSLPPWQSGAVYEHIARLCVVMFSFRILDES